MVIIGGYIYSLARCVTTVDYCRCVTTVNYRRCVTTVKVFNV